MSPPGEFVTEFGVCDAMTACGDAGGKQKKNFSVVVVDVVRGEKAAADE